MSRRRRTLAHPGQLALFGPSGEVIVPAPLELAPGEIDHRARTTFADLLRGQDRIEVAAGLTTLLGQPISPAMVDAYAAISKQGHRLPLAVAIATERLLNATAFSDLWGLIQGGVYVRGADVVKVRLGELALEHQTLHDWYHTTRRES